AYEGGVRVPTIVRWPGMTPAGTESDEPVMTIDYWPTFIEAAGMDVKEAGVDGQSLLPLLENRDASLNRDLFWHFPHYHAGGDSPYSAIRSGNYRLIEFHETGDLELYDLKSDIGESNDLSKEKPDKVAKLHTRMKKWREEVGAQMLTPNPQHDSKRATEVRKRAKKAKNSK
ncbi:MAG: DUF4976 domain-containing protein, partial [Verrucomicrobiales bacterium]|nr:DUF4976 domain-containing protein [Verrucomicrobiales bacterium]